MITPMDLVQAFAAAAVVATGTRAAWLVMNRLASRQAPPSALSRVEARLTELEQSTEAIALELERIGEAQRFSAMLLAERLPAASPVPTARLPRSGDSGRVATPH